jgi:hypothetical protein
MKEYFKKNGFCTVPEDREDMCCYSKVHHDSPFQACEFQHDGMKCSCPKDKSPVPQEKMPEIRTCSVVLSEEAKKFIEDNYDADT